MSYPTVAFKPTGQVMGSQPIAETSATQRHGLGEIIAAFDYTYGAGEFVYLLGAASTAAGDVVCFNGSTGATVRAVHGGATSKGPVAVAMSANLASGYGWYQISGSGPVKAGTVLANGTPFLTSTAGQIDDSVVAGDLIDGMLIKAADSGGFATCQLARPSVAGDVAGGTNSGDVTLAAIGSTPGANGASLSSQVLTLQPADGTYGGILTAGSQTIAGAKTMAAALACGSTLSVVSSLTNPAAIGVTALTPLGHSVAFNGRVNRAELVKTIDYRAYTAAAASQDVTLCTIAAGCRIVYFYVETTIAYAGLAGTIAIKVGSSAGANDILVSHDVKSAAVVKGLLDADMGAALAEAALIQGAFLPSWTVPTDISIRLTSGTGNIGAAGVTLMSAGSSTFYVGLEYP